MLSQKRLNKIYPVILSGGSGTRLWPLSRGLYPKQFLKIKGELSLLQQTILRVSDKNQFQNPLMICNEVHRFLASEQLKEIVDFEFEIILEPEGRNTAPAALLAAFHLLLKEEDPWMLILPSDHQLETPEVFLETVTIAKKALELGNFVTFGINPTKPETGYGYIKIGSPCWEPIKEGNRAYQSEGFYEKPDLTTAEHYVKSKEYLWNSGMFLFNAKQYIAKMSELSLEMVKACEEAIRQVRKDLNFLRPEPKAFLRCQNESIDCALMEKVKEIAVVPLACGWSDVGSFAALWENAEKDEQGNVALGDVILHQTNNTYLHSEGPLLSVIGVDNVVAIATKDAVLVMSRDSAQEVKNITKFLEVQKRSELLTHTRVFRPWGYYEVIDSGKNFQVKRILVKSGAKLSLQLHQHRSEHWVVVSGVGRVTKGDEAFDLKQNESTYIPQGVPHRLENQGALALEIIEVQSGDYLGEDDIIRLEDVYGRVEVETTQSEKEYV